MPSRATTLAQAPPPPPPRASSATAAAVGDDPWASTYTTASTSVGSAPRSALEAHAASRSVTHPATTTRQRREVTMVSRSVATTSKTEPSAASSDGAPARAAPPAKDTPPPAGGGAAGASKRRRRPKRAPAAQRRGAAPTRPQRLQHSDEQRHQCGLARHNPVDRRWRRRTWRRDIHHGPDGGENEEREPIRHRRRPGIDRPNHPLQHHHNRNAHQVRDRKSVV